MTGLTRDLASFVASFDIADAPRRAVEAARMGILDCVGVTIAGWDEEAPRLVAAMVQDYRGNDGAPEIPTGRSLSAADAAFVNGVAGHVLDYDDVGLDGHPSVAVTPAILAEGWALDSSGQDAIAAYLAGYEVWALIEELEPGQLHERGFHPTAVSGTLAAAAACARLHRLDAEKTTHALAIAASLASGLVANFGTMTKSLHAGRVGQSGVLAARLAKSGFTGSPDALEHQTGFLRAHSPSGNPRLDRGDWGLGETWRIEREGIHIKRYPVCYATHRSIDAMLSLADEHSLAPGDVEEIHVHTGKTQALMLRNQSPRTGLEAKFSMQFAMACALVQRRVGLQELTDDFVRRDDVVSVMRKVRVTTTDETMPGLPFAPDDRVSVKLKSGETIAHAPVVHARGSWQKPLSLEELREKFSDCCRDRLKTSQADQLFEALAGLENLPSLQRLPLTRSIN
jgi:2-methylcitrate dehydratase PrpD